jgi:uncharacterized protein
MEEQKKTLVLGASDNPSRYSYLALKKLKAYSHPVVAVGRKNTAVDGVTIHKEPVHEQDIDTVTLYLNPTHQQEYYNYILSLHPKRIIFNPGTENPELIQLAKENGIEPYIGCTLVMLSTGQY